MRIGIIDYNLGNLGSVKSAFDFFRCSAQFVRDPKTLGDMDLLVLSGVGNFKTAVSHLKERKLWDELDRLVIEEKKPILGICLGMQIFAESSRETGECTGFGWIPGKVVRIEGNDVKVPHMGWDRVIPQDPELFSGIKNPYFYFMHSYHFIPDDPTVVSAFTEYGTQRLVAGVKKGHIFGYQFHPEKSQGDGLRIIQNILEMVSCYRNE
jgi:glutamine amidotransferase